MPDAGRRGWYVRKHSGTRYLKSDRLGGRPPSPAAGAPALGGRRSPAKPSERAHRSRWTARRSGGPGCSRTSMDAFERRGLTAALSFFANERAKRGQAIPGRFRFKTAGGPSSRGLFLNLDERAWRSGSRHRAARRCSVTSPRESERGGGGQCRARNTTTPRRLCSPMASATLR